MSKLELLLATQNENKAKEIALLLGDAAVAVQTARSRGITDAAPEDGTTCEANALAKAKFIATKTQCWALADDAGIFIEALDGQPGVRSARWAGEGASDDTIIQYTLQRLTGKTNRRAYFKGVVALVNPKGEHWLFTGEIQGTITTVPIGPARARLPYDQLFIPEGKTQTFAEMSIEEKNQISHRAQALQKLKLFFRNINTPKY